MSFELDSPLGDLVHENKPQPVPVSSDILPDFTNLANVAAVANIFTLDMQHRASRNFKIETTDAVAKTIAITNAPTNTLVQLTVMLKYTNACAITYPSGITWQNASIPTFTAGKTYFLQFVSADGGATWLASFVGAW